MHVLLQAAECFSDFIRLHFTTYSQTLHRLSVAFRTPSAQDLADKHIAPKLKLKLAQAASEPLVLQKRLSESCSSLLQPAVHPADSGVHDIVFNTELP